MNHKADVIKVKWACKYTFPPVCIPCLERLWIFHVFPVWKDFEFFTIFLSEIPVWKDLEINAFSLSGKTEFFTISPVWNEKTLNFLCFSRSGNHVWKDFEYFWKIWLSRKILVGRISKRTILLRPIKKGLEKREKSKVFSEGSFWEICPQNAYDAYFMS